MAKVRLSAYFRNNVTRRMEHIGLPLVLTLNSLFQLCLRHTKLL
jgi:hypothetical protein